MDACSHSRCITAEDFEPRDLNLLVMAVNMPALCSGGRDYFCREFLNLGFMSILGRTILGGWGLSCASQDVCLAAFLESKYRMPLASSSQL